MTAPSLADDLDQHKAATWIQYRYFKACKGKCKLDRSRAEDYAYWIQLAATIERLDPERFLNQGVWESDGVNNIRDRDLPFKSWSYGIYGVQVDTAKMYFGKMTGRDLILDYRINILVAALHVRWLMDNRTNEDERKAEMAYNAGYNGVLQGKGTTYPGSIDTTLRLYKAFKESQYLAQAGKN